MGIFEVPHNVCHSSFLSPSLLETNCLGSLFKFLVKTRSLESVGIGGLAWEPGVCVVQVPGKSLCSPVLENFCSRWVRGTSLTCQWWGVWASFVGARAQFLLGELRSHGQGKKKRSASSGSMRINTPTHRTALRTRFVIHWGWCYFILLKWFVSSKSYLYVCVYVYIYTYLSINLRHLVFRISRKRTLTRIECLPPVRYSGPIFLLCSVASCFRLFVTPWTVAHSVHGPWDFPARYWSGLSLPPPRDLPYPGIEPESQVSCTGRWILYHCATWEALHCCYIILYTCWTVMPPSCYGRDWRADVNDSLCAHNLSYVSIAETVSGPPVLMVPFFLCDQLKLFVTGHLDLRTNDCILQPSLQLDVGMW